jgi:hypothetical protein
MDRLSIGRTLMRKPLTKNGVTHDPNDSIPFMSDGLHIFFTAFVPRWKIYL